MINELKTIRESLNNAKIDNGDRVRESDYRMRRYYEQREAACINALSALDRIEAQLVQPKVLTGLRPMLIQYLLDRMRMARTDKNVSEVSEYTFSIADVIDWTVWIRDNGYLSPATTKLTPEQVEKVMSVAWPWFTRFDPNDDSTCDDYINNKPEGHEPER